MEHEEAGRDPVSSVAPPPSPLPAPIVAAEEGIEPLQVEKQIDTEKDGKTATVPEKEFGHILFNPPTRMTRDETERVEVRISRQEVDGSGLQGTGEVMQDIVRVSDLMSVSLHGEKFKIVNISDTTQLLEVEGYTQWAFDVTPIEASNNEILTLKVTIQVKYGGKTAHKNKLVYSKPILIKVDSKNAFAKFISNGWQLLLGLLVVSAIAFVAMKKMTGNKKPKKRSGNEGIFISYRRDDSSGYTLAIYEQLKAAFGDDYVFMDQDDIPHGEDFVEHIEKVLAKANTLLVMIGSNWVSASNAKGRRLDDPNDFVRLEIAKALERGIKVIPVLLKGAVMPTGDELPEDLHKLSRKNAIRIHDDQFEASVSLLVDGLA